MKFLRKFTVLLLIISLLVSPAIAGEYTLPMLKEDLNVTDDGVTQITDTVTYNVSGMINGVYREIVMKGDQELYNVSVETPGYYNEVELEETYNGYRIKVWLYKDPEMTRQVSDESVEVTYHYAITKGIKIYDDIAEMQYNIWDNGWATGAETVMVKVTLPGEVVKSDTWFNPPTAEDINIDNNTITAVLHNLPEYTERNYEFRTLMPKSYFASDDNAQVIHKQARDEITSTQQDYINQINTQNAMAIIVTLLAIILALSPFYIYYKYGRDPKIAFKETYLTDLPYDDKPATVDALYGAVGYVSSDAFNATLLDLIDRGYFKVIIANKNNFVLKIANKPFESLEAYERMIISYLLDFADEHLQVSLNSIKNSDCKDFYEFYMAWKYEFRQSQSITEHVMRMYKGTGNHKQEILAYAMIFVSLVGIICMWMFCPLKTVFDPTLLLIGLIVEAFILKSIIYIDPGIMGSLTPQGLEYQRKWKSFKNYITDYSLIKEYPPESVQVWGRYLVYATAIGCAKTASKNMNKYFDTTLPASEYEQYPLYTFTSYGTDLLLFSAFAGLNTQYRERVAEQERQAAEQERHNNDTSPNTTFDDIGDIGFGGFGGGGGGVF